MYENYSLLQTPLNATVTRCEYRMEKEQESHTEWEYRRRMKIMYRSFMIIGEKWTYVYRKSLEFKSFIAKVCDTNGDEWVRKFLFRSYFFFPKNCWLFDCMSLYGLMHVSVCVCLCVHMHNFAAGFYCQCDDTRIQNHRAHNQNENASKQHSR